MTAYFRVYTNSQETRVYPAGLHMFYLFDWVSMECWVVEEQG